MRSLVPARLSPRRAARWPAALALLLLGSLAGALGTSAPLPSQAPALSCQEAPDPSGGPWPPGSAIPVRPLPAGITGRVAFYAAVYGTDGQPLRAVQLGDVDALHPLASAFKPLVVRAALQEVDAGRLSLGTRLETTPGRRSIEGYPAGRNTVEQLARLALVRSDNTASDILHLAAGPERVARAVGALSPCTRILHTTKALWAAQAGLLPDVFRPGVDGAGSAALPLEERLPVAQALNRRAQDLTGPQVEAALDRYFHGPDYDPALELAVQNTSTARAYAGLLARTLPGNDLKPTTRRLYRAWLADGCCKPAHPTLPAPFWGAKAGSGWRILTLTGAAELPGGQVLAYAYFNDGSDTLDAEDMERQIPALVRWLDATLTALAAGRPTP
ncbi:Beta-lactamase [Deinococcus phoenicis]|uniref:Beta-lactamase n=1 Tax=Deinococcus phoenicis TaxID=1476583 RepID=A0A016QNY8_9DEIO|nr:Beta-lactamase [Deinococcus phoenicis]